MAGCNFCLWQKTAIHHRQANRSEHVFAASFIHREGRCHHARMAIGQTHPFQQPLHRSVFTPAPVQRIKNHVARRFIQSHGQGAICNYLNHFKAFAPQRRSAFAPR